MTDITKTQDEKRPYPFNKFRYEIAKEETFPTLTGGNSRGLGSNNNFVGSYMVRKMIEAQERQMENQGR